MKIAVGIIGYGLSGRYLQAPFFDISEDFDLRAIVTSNSNPKEQFPGVAVITDVEDLLARADIDLISICSPSYTHFDLAMRALDAGKHLLVEKPFTATVAEAEAVFEKAKKLGKVVSVFQNRRFDADFLTLKNVLSTGILGDIVSYEARYDRYRPELNPKKWKEVENAGNGILYDLGSHILDQTISIFGIPKGFEGEKFTQREGSSIDDAFEIRLDYGHLKVKLGSSLLVKHLGPRYAVHGRLGSFVKYGLDVQEDHLKAGIMPGHEAYGLEPKNDDGLLHFEQNGQDVLDKVPTVRGNWMALFTNLAAAIHQKEACIIRPEEIIAQINILESIKRV